MTEFHFLQPLDVLFLRGNRLFGSSSANGVAVMPPWPSMASGAIRSQILVTHSVDAMQFANGVKLTGDLAASLGTPTEPGNFRLSHYTLAKVDNGKLQDVYWPIPADLIVISENTGQPEKPDQHIHYLQPHSVDNAIISSAPCRALPVLRTDKQSKPTHGLWLNKSGMQAWLNAKPITPEHLIESKDLWKTDCRLGIALDASGRTAAEGQLYTVDAVALADQIGFLTGINAADDLLPTKGVLRLGGDGRGAQHSLIEWDREKLQPNWGLIKETGRFRLVLTTPGLFEQGWLLPGISKTQHDFIWQASGFTANLVTASVSRSETISGWDLAENCPKPALKAASTGSVYWFDNFKGDVQALQKLVEDGLFNISAYPDKQRQAEGFNNILIAAWPHLT